jgi:PAS domain S-box-containing protein
VSPRLVARIVALAAVYAAVARLGLAMDAVGGFATLVWPPTGIALVALLVGGAELWPGVLLGALVTNLWIGGPPAVATAIAVGNTLEAVLGAYALGRVGFRPTLDRVRDVAALVLLAAIGSTLISAMVGVASLRLSGRLTAALAGETFRAWWIGDLIGDLVVAPLLLTLLLRPATPIERPRLFEAVALTTAPVLVAILVFALPLPPAMTALRQPFLLFPALVWPALRFGPRGVASMTFLITVVAIAGTTAGHGPFLQPHLRDSLAGLQVFVAAMAVGLLVLGALVAERRRAEQAASEGHALLRAVVDATTDAVFAKDRAGRYLVMNQAGARALDRSVADIVGRDDAALMPAAEAAALAASDRAILDSGETRTFEDNVPSAGQARVFWATKSPVRDEHGRVVGLVGIARDITERKRAEEALVEAIGARDEFLSIASHELRTPLYVLTLELGSLLRRMQKIGNAGAPGAFEAAVAKLRGTLRQTDRLNQLIESLLEVSRISAGRLHLEREPVDLLGLARDVMERFGEPAARAGCTLALHGTKPIVGQWDRLRLEQIVTNLLSNAMKYGAGKPVDVTIAGNARDATLVVRDRGIGIAPADVERIFGRFERAVSPRHFGGLGLGLYITRQIVEAHGGTIGVESRPGEGSTFTLALPLAARPASEDSGA